MKCSGNCIVSGVEPWSDKLEVSCIWPPLETALSVTTSPVPVTWTAVAPVLLSSVAI